MIKPGLFAVLGSGETSTFGGQLFEAVARHYQPPFTVRILETPAGFELNASRVAGRVGDFMSTRLQNYQPDVRLVPARKRGTANSPESPEILAGLLDSQMIFMGPGSPSYVVRQLQGSLGWDYIQALHRLGVAVVLASAATISFGRFALPVYEIYKVGEDPYWKPGLDFFKPFGLSLVFVPHWNNAEGGNELDTSHCFIGKVRFDPLYAQLPDETTVVGLDEHTGLIFDLEQRRCHVIGNSLVHIIKDGNETTYGDDATFSLSELGDFHMPDDEMQGIDREVWQMVVDERDRILAAKQAPQEAPEEVLDLVEQRQQARQKKQWNQSDQLRDEIAAMGWKVIDTPQGPHLERT